MLIGKLDQRITWQFSTPTQDEYGEPIDSWANLASTPTVWANVKVKAGGERFVSGGQQVQAELIHTVTIRYRSDLTVKMRGVNGTRYLYVENVYDPTGAKVWLVLECREEQF